MREVSEFRQMLAEADAKLQRTYTPSFVALLLSVGSIAVLITAATQLSGWGRVTALLGLVTVSLSIVNSMLAESRLVAAYRTAEGCANTFLVDYQSALEALSRHQNFLLAFRPSIQEVMRVLELAARRVRTACENQDEFLRKGLGEVAASTNPGDLEDSISTLKGLQSDYAERYQRAVNEAKREFYRLRDLARNQEYAVPDSWLPLAGLPHSEPKKAPAEPTGSSGITDVI